MLQEPRAEPRRIPHLRVVPRKELEAIETTGGTVSTRVAKTLAELVALESEWHALFQRSTSASPPLRWEWVREWWRFFGTPQRTLAVVTVRRGKELIGVLPLYKEVKTRNKVDFFVVSLSEVASHSFYPEYIDVLTAPGTDTIVARAIIQWVLDGGLGRYRRIHFGLCRTDGILARVIAPEIERSWGSVTRRQLRAPIADLRGGFESYLGKLSANSRQQMRRLLRSFQELGEFRFEIANSKEEADSFLLELIELHQMKWRAEGEPGAFSTPERIAFHRAVVTRLFEHVFLSRLTYKGKTITALYGFLVGEKFDFYQSGNSTVELPLKRPGILAHLLTMGALIKRGIETYDFLEGEAHYKLHLRTATFELTDVTVYGPSPLNLVRRYRSDLSALFQRFLR